MPQASGVTVAGATEFIQDPKVQITSNAVWLVACRLSANVFNLVLFVAVSRYFGPEGVGTYSYAFAIAGFVYVVGSLGLDEYGIREYSRLPKEMQQSFLAGLLGAQMCMLVVASIGVTAYLAITQSSWVTTGIVLSLSVYQLGYSLARSLFIPAIAEQAMAGPALAELLCRGGAFVIAAIAIRSGAPLSVAMGTFAAFGVALVYSGMRSARQRVGTVQIAISRSEVIGKIQTVWSFAAAEIFGQIFVRISLITLTLTLGEAIAGSYATGLKFVEVACMPLIFLGVAAYPRLSQLSITDPQRCVKVAGNFWMVAVLMAGLVTWGLYFVVPSILVPLLGDKFAGTEPILQLMTFLAILQLLEIVLVRLSLSADLNVARFYILAGGTCASLLLNFWLIPSFGTKGAIAAGTLSLAILNIMYAITLRKRAAGALPGRPLWIVILALGSAAAVTWAVQGSLPLFMSGVIFLSMFLLVSIPFAIKQLRTSLRNGFA